MNRRHALGARLRAVVLMAAGAALACDEHEPAADTPSAGTAPAGTASAGTAAVNAPAAAPAPEPTIEKPPESVAAQHVLITYRGAKGAPPDIKRTKAAAKTLAEEVAAKAKAGSDFSALVQAHSEDLGTKDRLGSVGKFTPDKMVKPFSDAAFRLRVDEVSAPVETEFGFHVIKRNQ
ncbi:MAG TPA: peptidylprolyl isomerase [Polyangiaceae bacterium]|nr:peptidylprolyl isomerase [Polyangiaceae bacterium]